MRREIKNVLMLLFTVCLIFVPYSVVCATEGEIQDGEYNGLTYMYNNEKVVITGYTGTEPDVTIPEEINGVPVTDIAEEAFKGNDVIQSVTIEATIKTIPRNCFVSSSLIEVNMSDTIICIEFSAFSNCKSLTTIDFSQNLEEIKGQAFYACDSIENIVLPNSVTKVVGDAFGSCASLKSIEMPNDLEEEAFYFRSCTSLSNIVLPDTVTYIASFRDCHSLSSIVLPEGVKKIADNAFMNCYCLTEIYIPENVTYIGEQAFDGCNFLTIYGEAGSYAETYANNNNIHFSEGEMPGKKASYLSNNQFTYIVYEDNCMLSKYNGSESDLTIPSNIDGVAITHIAPRMFEGSSIQNLIIEAEIEILPESCFFISSIKTIQLPNSLKKIDGDCFNGCRSLEKIVLPEGVTTLGRNCFQSCDSLETIVIPSTMINIGLSIFASCEGLKTVEFEEGSTSVPQWMFSGCTSLKTVILPDSIESIELGAFLSCGSLEQIVIPNKVTEISDTAFMGCSRLKQLKLPEGIVSIGDQAFSGCTSLAGIYIPDTTVTISSNAFELCELLTVCGNEGSYAQTYADVMDISFSTDDVSLYTPKMIVIDDVEYTCGKDKVCVYGGTGDSCNVVIQKEVDGKPVVSLKKQAFCNDDTIESLDIQAKIEEISFQCFGLCSNLKDVKLPTTVKKIKSNAFGDCSELESVSLPNELKVIEQSAFADCSNLKNIELPEQLQRIDNQAFSGCTLLESIEIPGSIQYVDIQVFYGCRNLTQVRLPDGLKKIEQEAFYGCERLTQIYIPKSVNSIEGDAFTNCYFLVINAPKGSYAIEYAKTNGIKYIEIANEEDGSFNGEVGSDVLEDIGEGQELPIISGNGSAIFDPNATIEICHRHGNKGIKFHCKFKKKHEMDNHKQHHAMHDAHRSGGKVMDFDLVNGDGEKIIFNTDENDGCVTITIPYEAPVSANEVKVYYIDAEGNKKDMNGVYDPSKKTITFTTTHFSLFTIETDVDLCEEGHEYGEEGEVIAATCEESGCVEYECLRCGEKNQTDQTDALGHIWDNGVVTVNPTITQKGMKTYGCLREGCDETKTEELPMLEQAISEQVPTEVVVKPEVGSILSDEANMAEYKVLKQGEEVSYQRTTDKKVNEVVIPSAITLDGVTYKVTSIEANAFAKCKKLKKVTIGENVTTIGKKAFYKCTKLTKITIPANVSKIDKEAFSGCKKLKKITIKSSVLKTIGKNALKGIDKKATIKVPKKQLKKYKKLFKSKTGYKKTMKIKK